MTPTTYLTLASIDGFSRATVVPSKQADCEARRGKETGARDSEGQKAHRRSRIDNVDDRLRLTFPGHSRGPPPK